MITVSIVWYTLLCLFGGFGLACVIALFVLMVEGRIK